MSYDVRVWSANCTADLTALLGDREQWVVSGDEVVLPGRGWQLVVGAQQRVEPEDLPLGAAGLLPGISFLTEFNLQPISAPKVARAALVRAARALAKQLHGVIEDPQEGSLTLPGGVKRYLREARPERFDALEMRWWFNSDVLESRLGLDRLLRIFERMLPEALPRRYGLHEPPQYRLTELGREHLLEFLAVNSHDTVVWYPERPVLGVHLGLPKRPGASTRGYRSNHFSVSVEAAALRQPGWEAGLKRTWMQLSELLQPFYGEVRTLRGFTRMGATYGIDNQTDSHPVRSWWWNGIPESLGHAVVVGPPYVDLWPELKARAQRLGDLAVLAPSPWGNATDLAAQIGGVPSHIRQPCYPDLAAAAPAARRAAMERSYPATWPFEFPYAEGW